MGKAFWVAVGAAGGILLYRRATRTAEAVKERNLAENLQAAGEKATAIAASIRSLSQLLPQPKPASQQTIIVPPREG